MKWLGQCLAARSVDFLNYCLSRQSKVVASNSATSLTRNVMRHAWQYRQFLLPNKKATRIKLKALIFFQIFIYLLLLSVKSVEGNSFADHFKRVELGINFMPGTRYESKYFSYYEFKFSYSAGVLIHLRSSESFGVTSGIQYSNIWNQGKTQGYFCFCPTPDTLISTVKSGNSFRFIDVPLLANYILGKSKIKFTINGGILINYFINLKTTNRITYTNNQIVNRFNISSDSNINRFQIAPIASLGIKYDTNDEYNFKIEPTIRYQSVNYSNSSSNGHFWELGINFSLFKKIK